MNNKEIRKGLNRHKFVYHFLRILIGWLIMAICSFTYKPHKIKDKPVLILSNHNSDFDPLLMVISLKKHFKFVASANIMSGPVGKIIKFLAGPIPRGKGASADQTVQLIIDNLNAGIDVAMFPEGNKSWDGSTNFISRRTADIFKQTRCGLVTYRFDGGYLRSPRWSRYSRRGRLIGQVVGVWFRQPDGFCRGCRTNCCSWVCFGTLFLQTVRRFMIWIRRHSFSAPAFRRNLRSVSVNIWIPCRYSTIATAGNGAI